MKTGKVAFAVLCYLIGFAVIFYYFDFFTGFFVPKDINSGNPQSLGHAVLIDLGLIALFALQHSVMARPGFKQWMNRHLPVSLNRSVYILLTSIGLGLLIWLWQPVPLVIYDFEGTAVGNLLLGLYYLGWAVGLLSSFEIDHFELFGLRQAINPGHEGVQHLKKPFFYRIVRHPNYLGWILIHWMAPTLTLGHLLLAAGMTAYIYIGLVFEEKELILRFGRHYLDYKLETPRLNPLLYPFKKHRKAMFLIKGTAAFAAVGLIVQSVSFFSWIGDEMAMMKSDDPEIWQEEILRLKAQNLPKASDSTAVLFVGSSSFRFWDRMEEGLHPVKVINNGFGGAKITDVLHFREALIDAFRPDKLVLFIGTNDISGNENDKSPGELARLYGRLLHDVHARLPDCKIYLLPITPTLARWEIWPKAQKANQLLRKLAGDSPRVTYIECERWFLDDSGKPVWKYFKWDGTHLNRSGYQVWSALLKEHLLPNSVQAKNGGDFPVN